MDVLIFALVLVLSLLLPPCISRDDKPIKECGGNHVCTTLMRYKDGTTVDEGDNCYCRSGEDACFKDWDETSASSLTWQHYERAHWAVQYRFCTPVFQEKKNCQEGELAAVVETDVKKWEPFVSTPRCVCDTGVSFKLMGWKREGAVWKYFYHCEKDECPVPSEKTQSVCAKIYIDTSKPDDKVNEMKFLCNCPEGHLCPAKFDNDKDSRHVIHDEIGSYVTKLCEPVVKKKITTV